MPRRDDITDNIDGLIDVIPPRIQAQLRRHGSLQDLLEVVLDLGRPAEARFAEDEVVTLNGDQVGQQDIDFVAARVGEFGGDNRAGIERTLHRISAIRNRSRRIVGLTCRVGRAVYGTIDIIRDVVESGRNILLLGRPGVGKTTKLREVARVLADEFGKRVVVVDTSNEIAGDGDIPHPAIGRARRMQVESPQKQHDVMIEAVENHMPEVIIIDEIGNEADAFAARTIAERGVQLIGTAHGNTLTNLYQNPTLADLVGGIQAVTLGDEEARRRGTQKTVLERRAPPTFDILVEIVEMERLAIHHDVAATVDALLRGESVKPEIRVRNEQGEVEVLQEAEQPPGEAESVEPRRGPDWLPPVANVYPSGISRSRVEKAIRELRAPARVTMRLEDADVVLALRGQRGRRPRTPSRAPEFTIRSNTYGQIYSCLRQMFEIQDTPREQLALEEAVRAAERVLAAQEPVELLPQNAYIRRLQHEYAAQHNLRSDSIGKEPRRRVRISPA